MKLIECPSRPNQPIFRWAGSKRQQVKYLAAIAPIDISTYVEPFAGSAVLFWKLQPKRAVLGDLNRDLINAYECIRQDPEKVFLGYVKYPNDESFYYRVREEFWIESESFIRASMFIYLNRYCFNGIYRTSKSGKFNVPYGGQRSGRLPSLETLNQYSKELDRVEIVCADFQDTIENSLSRSSFFFIDPPYFTTQTRVFNEYGAKTFSEIDLDRLKGCLDRIDKSGGKFLVTYLDTPEVRSLSKKWSTSELQFIRKVSGFQKGRKAVSELVFSNFELKI